MYKKAMLTLTLAYLALFFLIMQKVSVKKNEVWKEAGVRDTYVEEVYTSKEVVGISHYTSSNKRSVSCCILEIETEDNVKSGAGDFSTEEIEILERIVEAEAGGEDEIGKLLVANVVLNRVKSLDFPDTISEVVFQTTNGVTQFSPVKNGRYASVNVSAESVQAVERALAGEDVSEGALYFAARRYANAKNMKWFDENLEYLFQHGGHEFFK